MADSMDKVRRVTALIGEMTSGAQEQAVGMTQIKTAVDQLESITQQNAGMVRQLATSAEVLQGQAGSVEASMRVIRTGRQDAQPPLDAVALRRAMKAQPPSTSLGTVKATGTSGLATRAARQPRLQSA